MINVTSLPTGGANYRVVKTVANGNWFQANAQPLTLGVNTIPVNGVAFDRSVKIQFGSGAINFSSIVHNGNTMFPFNAVIKLDGETTVTTLSGTGSRMVTADANGLLSATNLPVDGQDGATGPQGATGLQGIQGVTGAQGVTG